MKEVRICDVCGYHNSLSSLFCENDDCGEDISHIPPSILQDKTVLSDRTVEHESEVQERLPNEQMKTVRMTGIRLVHTASGYEIPIPVEGGIIGRLGTIHPEHFQNNQFVSKEHAKIELRADGYVLIDLHSTNGTKINGIRIISGEAYPLKDKDRIVFANMEYLVEM
ncbi:FHA domain-containing protein [Parageobacillus sp. G301]|uniref:FHA domain-containing protein n=1 Tax=Parageobacillus sp. G301 TaxID=2998290 RepID=UPI0024993BF0|nr:FHA domain-containing protein [Parageobacillus sp. G301]GLH65073.1 hypothetical protein PG301_29120 [Parageobacillus sp. G301]